MAGFGHGIAFSAKPDNAFLQLHQQEQQRKEAQRRAEEAARAKLAENQDRTAEKSAEHFRQNLDKVHPVYSDQVLNTYHKFAEEVVKLKEQYPHNFTQTPEYLALERQAWKDMNDYTSASKKAYEIEKLDPDKYAFMPGYENLPTALQDIDPDSLKGITKNEKGILTGQPYYAKLNPFSDMLSDVEKLDFSMTPDGLKIEGHGEMNKVSQTYKRPESAIRAIAENYWNNNEKTIGYQFPDMDKETFITETVANMPREKFDGYFVNRPKPDKDDGDGDGSGGKNAAYEDILRTVAKVATGEGDWQEVKPSTLGSFSGQKPFQRTYQLQGTPLGLTKQGKEYQEEIDFVDKLADGTFKVTTKRGNVIDVQNKQFFQTIIRPYFRAAERGDTYENKVSELANNYGLFGTKGSEDWESVYKSLFGEEVSTPKSNKSTTPKGNNSSKPVTGIKWGTK